VLSVSSWRDLAGQSIRLYRAGTERSTSQLGWEAEWQVRPTTSRKLPFHLVRH
jgi:hypothetical protein